MPLIGGLYMNNNKIKSLDKLGLFILGVFIVVSCSNGEDTALADESFDIAGAPGTTIGSAQSQTPDPAFSEEAYVENLDLIKASTIRSTVQDNSPFTDVSSAELPVEQLYGPRSEYLNNPDGNPEQSFPIPGGGQFRASCEFSHFAYDDPLISPNQPGAAHLHMFFGNTDTNAFTTYDRLLNTGSSTCNGAELNRSGYWAPAVFDGAGNVRIPERIVVYYKNEANKAGVEATAYPERAALIPPADINTIDRADTGKSTFVCSDQFSSNGGASSNTMVACDGSQFGSTPNSDGVPSTRVVLEMNVKFPNCWNGEDPSNWADNYSIPETGGWYSGNCPESHSILLPHLEYFINYVVEPGENTSDWYLSSDVGPQTRTIDNTPGSTAHADWWGAWHRDTLDTWIDNCANLTIPDQSSGCGFGYLSDGGPNAASPFDGLALKYREQYGGPNKVPASTIYSQLCPEGPTAPNATFAAYCNP